MAILLRGEVWSTPCDRAHRRAHQRERIAAVGPELEAPAGSEIVDTGGCLIMRGGIDPRTHMEFHFMGTVTADEFEWGTKAALSGGTTTIIDMCVPDPRQPLVDAYRDWLARSEKAASDYGYHMSITWWSDQVSAEMETCVREYGVNSNRVSATLR
jgi:dihydropyrimidinase